MTEDDAKTKWCPVASSRVLSYIDSDGATITTVCEDDDRGLTTGCLASACMAWRSNGISGGNADLKDRSMGYCGLAGKP